MRNFGRTIHKRKPQRQAVVDDVLVLRATGAVVPPLIMLALALWGIRVPFAYALVDHWQADAIWWSFPVASIASVTMASLYYQFGNWRKVQLGIAQRRDPVPSA